MFKNYDSINGKPIEVINFNKKPNPSSVAIYDKVHKKISFKVKTEKKEGCLLSEVLTCLSSMTDIFPSLSAESVTDISLMLSSIASSVKEYETKK